MLDGGLCSRLENTLTQKTNYLFVAGSEGSLSGYHVCNGTEMVPVTRLVSHRVSHTEPRPCGGWLPWKMCNVTLYTIVFQSVSVDTEIKVKKCCEGYERLGGYCALGEYCMGIKISISVKNIKKYQYN